ncbi:MAG: rhodoquinone biosynthesis methyltransferase RquA [Hyphomicrobiaceae bacterium]
MLPIPKYLEQLYWWAYVRPNAVKLFERQWLVNAILFGHYGQLRDDALAELGNPQGRVQGRTLQVACVYGNLTSRLCSRMADDARLDVVDILPVQLDNLHRKLAPDTRVSLKRGDASALDAADASYEQVLLFFLLHEMPETVRRATLREAIRVLRPRGKLVIVDYARPARLNPVRPLMHQVFKHLEPYAFDLWAHEIAHFMPQDIVLSVVKRRTWFGGLYQMLVVTSQEE